MTHNGYHPGDYWLNSWANVGRPRISAKPIAEQLGFSRERVGYIIHEDLDMRKLSAKWVPKCLNEDQKRQQCQKSEKYSEFFRRDTSDFLLRLVTMNETWLYHYDSETKQQWMEWRHSGLSRPDRKNSEWKIRWKFSALFFGIKTAFSSLIIFQRAKLSTRVLVKLAEEIERHFEGKTPRHIHKGWLVLARQCPSSMGTCNPAETCLPGLPVSWSSILFSGSEPIVLPPVPWIEKIIESW